MVKTISVSKSLLVLVIAGSLAGQVAAAEKSWFETGSGLLDSFWGDKESSQESSPKISSLSTADVVEGLKEALIVGTETVVGQLGQRDGFNADQAIHIPLPAQLSTVKNMLDKVGMGGLMDDLETKVNQAAEAATPEAKKLFLNAIKEMSFEDAKRIYNGPDDAATQYLREKMDVPLGKALRPLIENSLSEVGAIQLYDQAMGRYENIPFVPDVKANLTDHTVAKGMDGIFYYLAQEEAAIRKDPVKRTTEVLRKVFTK